MDPLSAEPPIAVDSCLGNQVCSTETRYARPNSSVPFDSTEPVFIQRKCQPTGSPICDFSSDAPCEKSDNNMYVCYSCCSKDRCNTNVPTFSSAPVFKFSVSMIIISFLSFVALMFE